MNFWYKDRMWFFRSDWLDFLVEYGIKYPWKPTFITDRRWHGSATLWKFRVIW